MTGMPVLIQKLEEASSRYPLEKPAESLGEAQTAGLQTAYLCHNPKDLLLAEGLQVLLKDRGWNVYVDWEEETMSETPTSEMAEKTQARIRECEWFLFLATENSMNSRWCAWELGYAEGMKPFDAILVIPTKNDNEVWFGGELLQLYRHIEVTSSQRFGAFRPGDDHGVLVADLSVPAAKF
jgi:hypothetical protein